MPEYLSKERVERDNYLVYAEGDPIPESDIAELKRQGYIKGASAGSDKADPAPVNKARKAPAKSTKK